MNKEVINIVVCGDLNVEVGLHVTLYSVLQKSTCDFHNIYFINKGYGHSEIFKLQQTLIGFKELYKLNSIPFEDIEFDSLKPLHGNLFTYTKLVIPNLVNVDKVLYLDLDLVIDVDVSKLWDLDMRDFIIAANPERRLNEALEWGFFKNFGFEGNDRYFNAGVMLMNLGKWREFNYTKKTIEFAKRHSDLLLTADQTVLNYFFYNNYLKLEDCFNRRIGNSKYNGDIGSCIYHFYGRPKMWDLFVETLNPNYHIFDRVHKKTFLSKESKKRKIRKQDFIKFLKMYKSYTKLILRLDL